MNQPASPAPESRPEPEAGTEHQAELDRRLTNIVLAGDASLRRQWIANGGRLLTPDDHRSWFRRPVPDAETPETEPEPETGL